VPAPHLNELIESDEFTRRHIGPSPSDVATMLAVIGEPSTDALIDATMPDAIRSSAPLDLPPAVSEVDAIARLRAIAAKNRRVTSLIGMGYHGTITPPVIARNVLENPAWYTAYTPYQPEISQGRLEALVNYQTMVCDLTGLDIANSSLLDEATAAAEAMALARRAVRGDRSTFFVDADTHPQTIAVLRTRAEPVGIRLLIGDVASLADEALVDDLFGGLVSSPTSTGAVVDPTAVIERIHELGGLAVVATDLLACVLLRSPGTLGADVAVGSSQRFGVPLGYGGPHAGFMAVRSSAARSLPGRLVGVSTDTGGRPALRLALQTREQHIRREKATSNICTAQVLLANLAGFYAAWHGPDGLRRIAQRVHGLATYTAHALVEGGHTLRHEAWFDTLTVDVADADAVVAAALDRGLYLRRVDGSAVGITFDETT
jgi:glycine dehydrogenase